MQLWIFCSGDKEEKKAVIAFRGTEPSKWKDVFTDSNVTRTALDIERSEKLSMVGQKLFSDPNHTLYVHKGFYSAYKSVNQTTFAVLESMIGNGEGWTVYTTGHSLGGALSTLCTFELASR